MPRRQARVVLKALDKAKTQWYHFTTIVVAGMGFLTDAYDLFCIATVTKLLGRIYYYNPTSRKPGVLPPNINAAVNGVALCGTLVGQLFFGFLGDKLGRKRVYGLTLQFMVFCSLGSALSFGHTSKAVMTTLCWFRFWLGFGIGGDYPLSATIMSEYANTKTRGAFIAAVFAMQGIGILLGGTAAIIISSAFRHQYPAVAFDVDAIGSTPPQADFVWRIIFALGSIPAILTFYYRSQMPETARYTALVEGNAKQAATDMSTVLDVQLSTTEGGSRRGSNEEEQYLLFSKQFFAKHGVHLLGTTSCWFLLDIAFYSQNLFQKDVFTAVGWLPNPKTMSALQEVFMIARAQTLIALCSSVPGYWVTVALIDVIGRFAIQLQGFFFMTVFMFSLTIPYQHLKDNNHTGFVVLYAFTFFFANFGPNSTTFIVPAELFPARFRSTCHGISAAAGKAGAIIGAFGFLYAAQSSDLALVEVGYTRGIGVQHALFVLAVTNLCGFVCTFFVPETNQKSLEEISGENRGSESRNSSLNRAPESSNVVEPSNDLLDSVFPE